MPVDIWLGWLLGIIIIASIACLEMKSILSSLVTLGVVGLLVSFSFLILQAPDLALVQFVYEILVLSMVVIVMTGAESKEAGLEIADNVTHQALTVLVLVPILIFGYFAFKELPVFGQPLMRVSKKYIDLGAKESGISNIVAAIALNFRVYDTLGEAAVIVAGVLGAITIMRKAGRRGHGE
jgi:multicomponent Na+:H+ antiporter subunit B